MQARRRAGLSRSPLQPQRGSSCRALDLKLLPQSCILILNFFQFYQAWTRRSLPPRIVCYFRNPYQSDGFISSLSWDQNTSTWCSLLTISSGCGRMPGTLVRLPVYKEILIVGLIYWGWITNEAQRWRYDKCNRTWYSLRIAICILTLYYTPVITHRYHLADCA